MRVGDEGLGLRTSVPRAQKKVRVQGLHRDSIIRPIWRLHREYVRDT